MRSRRLRWVIRGVLGWCLVISLTGCWDQRPVETRAAVAALGIDPGAQPGDYRFTVVFPNVTTTATSIASTPTNQEYFHYTVSAPNLPDALAAIQRQQSRALYLGQIRLVAISTRLPTTVWRRLVQSTVQSGRMVLTFVVVGTPQAEALVTLAPPSEVVPELALYRTLTCQCQPFRITGRAWHLWVQMETPGMTPVVPQVERHADHYVLHGLTLLTPGRPVVWSPLDTWGWAYATGHVHEGLVTVHVQDDPVTVGRIHGHAVITFHVLGEHIVVDDHLQYTGQLVAGGDALGNPLATDRAVERAAALHVLAQVEHAVHQAQATGSDPFGWHRDLLWTDSTVSARSLGESWRHWQVRVTVQFLLHNEGVLR